MRILLIEDHLDSAKVFSHLLEQCSYDVIAVTTCMEAKLVLHKHDVGIVISDIHLKDGDGCDLLRELRSKRSDVQGIAITGDISDDMRQRCRDAGFRELFTKPFRIGAVIEAIERLASENQAGDGAQLAA